VSEGVAQKDEMLRAVFLTDLGFYRSDTSFVIAGSLKNAQ